MDGPMIAVLVVGSIATVAVAAATIRSYNDNSIGIRRRIKRRDFMLPREYYPPDRNSIWPIESRQSRRDDLENIDDESDYLSARGSYSGSYSGSVRDSLNDFGRGSSRISLRDSIGPYGSVRSSFGGKRKSRKKI
jgi:hypothetical protein